MRNQRNRNQIQGKIENRTIIALALITVCISAFALTYVTTVNIQSNKNKNQAKPTDPLFAVVTLTPVSTISPSSTDTATPLSTISPSSVPTVTPTLTPIAQGDFTQGVTEAASNQIKVWFNPTVPSSYVILHYKVSNQSQQNVYMDGNHQYSISGIHAGDTISYNFTYVKSENQYDTPSYTYIAR